MKKTKRSFKSLIIILSIFSLLFLVLVNRERSKTNSVGGIFSKKLSDKASISLKENQDGKNNLIYINLDGFSYKTYEEANKNPATETKNINELIKNGVLFTNAKTGIPSITDSMQQSIVSGAWPYDTGNCYRYYDFEKEKVVEYTRQNKLENIAQAAHKNKVGLLSINGWFFKEKGSNEEKDNLYLESSKDDGYKSRFEILKKVLRGESIEAYGKTMSYDLPPQFITLYADDIDSSEHNLNDKMSEDLEVDLQNRQAVEKRTLEALHKIDEEIGQVIEILKERKLYEKTNFVITTDHGMVPFGVDVKEEEKEWSYSQMPDLLETIAEVGRKHIGRVYKVEMINTKDDKPTIDSDIVVTTVGLQAQVKFKEKPSKEIIEDIINSVKNKSYYGSHLDYEGLIVRGSMPEFADLLISPKPPYHFSHDFQRNFYAVNQHDSLEQGAQQIFTMISGPDIKKTKNYDAEIHNIDMAPTMARLLGFEGPKDATGKVVDDVLVDRLKGPKLTISDLDENIKTIEGDLVNLKIETETESQVYVNKELVGSSDKEGNYLVEKIVETNLERLVVEVKKDDKITRKLVFVRKI